jgi:hypothetical protein
MRASFIQSDIELVRRKHFYGIRTDVLTHPHSGLCGHRSHRDVPSHPIPGNWGATGPPSGGYLDPRHIAVHWHRRYGWTCDLHDQPGMNGLVIGCTSELVALVGCCAGDLWRTAPGGDMPNPWQKLDGHGRDQGRASADHERRWVRHPFYVATALALLANSLVTANWFLALTGGLGFGLLVV